MNEFCFPFVKRKWKNKKNEEERKKDICFGDYLLGFIFLKKEIKPSGLENCFSIKGK